MPNTPLWIVCETTGRWAAALRVTLLRRQTGSVSRVVMPRVQEVRSLADFEAGIQSHHNSLGFVEISLENLASVLELLAKYARRNSHLIALTADNLGGTSAIDALTEAGALCVVSAPRQMGITIEVAEQYGAVRLRAQARTGDESITERAWAALPWQDA